MDEQIKTGVEADVCHLANAIESSELLVSIIVRRYNFLHFFSLELLGERVDICAEFFGDGAAQLLQLLHFASGMY